MAGIAGLAPTASKIRSAWISFSLPSALLTINVRSSLNPLVALAAANPPEGRGPLSVTFSAVGFHPRDERPIESVVWYLPDGGVLYGQQVTTTISQTGVHQVKVIVTDDLGQSDDAFVTVIIDEGSVTQEPAGFQWILGAWIFPLVVGITIIVGAVRRPPRGDDT